MSIDSLIYDIRFKRFYAFFLKESVEIIRRISIKYKQKKQGKHRAHAEEERCSILV